MLTHDQCNRAHTSAGTFAARSDKTNVFQAQDLAMQLLQVLANGCSHSHRLGKSLTEWYSSAARKGGGLPNLAPLLLFGHSICLVYHSTLGQHAHCRQEDFIVRQTEDKVQPGNVDFDKVHAFRNKTRPSSNAPGTVMKYSLTKHTLADLCSQ